MLALFAPGLEAAGQTQCEAEFQAYGALPYQHRGEGETDRCEGFYLSQVSAPPFQLIALSLGIGTVPPGNVTELKLRPVSKLAEAGPVFLQGQDKERRSYYRLYARIPRNASLRWPLNDVVMKQAQLIKRIGLYAYTREAGDRIYLPVEVAMDGKPVTGDLLMSVRVGVALDEVKWRVREDKDGGRFGAWRPLADRVVGGETLEFNPPVRSGERAVVEIAAYENSNNRPVSTLYKLAR